MTGCEPPLSDFSCGYGFKLQVDCFEILNMVRGLETWLAPLLEPPALCCLLCRLMSSLPALPCAVAESYELKRILGTIIIFCFPLVSSEGAADLLPRCT